jgi:hypothetical protein
MTRCDRPAVPGQVVQASVAAHDWAPAASDALHRHCLYWTPNDVCLWRRRQLCYHFCGCNCCWHDISMTLPLVPSSLSSHDSASLRTWMAAGVVANPATPPPVASCASSSLSRTPSSSLLLLLLRGNHCVCWQKRLWWSLCYLGTGSARAQQDDKEQKQQHCKRPTRVLEAKGVT